MDSPKAARLTLGDDLEGTPWANHEAACADGVGAGTPCRRAAPAVSVVVTRAVDRPLGPPGTTGHSTDRALPSPPTLGGGADAPSPEKPPPRQGPRRRKKAQVGSK
jgi:hypothetical protein